MPSSTNTMKRRVTNLDFIFSLAKTAETKEHFGELTAFFDKYLAK